MSSLRRGHANLLCIVPIFADDLVRGSAQPGLRPINGALRFVGFPLWLLPIVRCKIVGAVRELNPRPLAPKARIIPLDQQPTGEAALKNMLDGIRTRNPQIRSLMRYPLRHEHLKPVRARRSPVRPKFRGQKWAQNNRQQRDSNSRGISSN